MEYKNANFLGTPQKSLECNESLPLEIILIFSMLQQLCHFSMLPFLTMTVIIACNHWYYILSDQVMLIYVSNDSLKVRLCSRCHRYHRLIDCRNVVNNVLVVKSMMTLVHGVSDDLAVESGEVSLGAMG